MTDGTSETMRRVLILFWGLAVPASLMIIVNSGAESAVGETVARVFGFNAAFVLAVLAPVRVRGYSRFLVGCVASIVLLASCIVFGFNESLSSLPWPGTPLLFLLGVALSWLLWFLLAYGADRAPRASRYGRLCSYFRRPHVADAFVYLLVFWPWAYVSSFLTRLAPLAGPYIVALSVSLLLRDTLPLRWNLSNYSRLAGFLWLSAALVHVLFTAVHVYDPTYTRSLLERPVPQLLFSFVGCIWVMGRRPLDPFLSVLLLLLAASAAAPNLFERGENASGPVLRRAVSEGAIWYVLGFQLLLVTRQRVHVRLYVLLAAVASLVIFSALDSTFFALLLSLGFGLSLVAVNFPVQFIRDNGPDVARLWRMSSWPQRHAIFWRSVCLWIPGLVVFGAGTYLATLVHREFEAKFYSANLLTIADSQRSVPPRERDVKMDVLFTLAQQRDLALQAFVQRVRNAQALGYSALSRLPDQVEQEVESFRPPLFAGPLCNDFGIRVLGQRIGLGTTCRGILGIVDWGVQSWFSSTAAKINTAVSSAALKAEGGLEAKSDAVLRTGTAQIEEAFGNLATIVGAVFMVYSAVAVFSLFTGVGALFGAFAVILARVAYDSGADGPRGSINAVLSSLLLSTRSSSTPAPQSPFQLTQGVAAKIDCTMVKTHLFFYDPAFAGSDTGWYHTFRNLDRGGAANFVPTVPDKLTLTHKRVVKSKLSLFFNDVDTSVPKQQLAAGNEPWVTPVDGCALLAIQITAGNDVVFRLEDLRAYTKNVRIASSYSTHVGAYALRFGKFLPVARVRERWWRRGESTSAGTLVLAVPGMGEARTLKNGEQSPATAVRAFDHRTEFVLGQSLRARSVWFGMPDVITPHGGSAVRVTKGSPTSVLVTPFRLLRFLLLPF